MGLVDFGSPAPDSGGFAGGMMGGVDVGTVLGALGQSLLTSPRQNPLQGFGTAIQQANVSADKDLERKAIVLALKKQGFSDADAVAFSLNPLAAKLAVEGQSAAKGEAAARLASGIMSGQGSGDASAPSLSPRMTPAAPAGPAAGASLNGTGAEIQTKFVDNLKAGGLTNPYGLAAVAAYAQHESRYDPKNINGQWSDPSESGQAGTSGGILSWRDDRLNKMRTATQGAADPVAAQAQFTLNENPELTARLQSAKSAEEANALMADAWKFAGYNRRDSGEYAARLATTRSYADRFSGAGNQAPVRVASADPLAGYSPTPGGGADNPDPGAPRAGAPVLPPAGPSSPLGRPVQIANNEAEAQVLESRMGMLPRSTYGITPDPASPPGAGLGRPMVAQADLPAPGAQPAGFRIPPGATGTQTPPEEKTVFNDKGTALIAIQRATTALAVPNLPDATRKALEAQRAQAQEVLKPTDQARRLMDAGYQFGTPEFQEAARKLTFGEKDDKEKLVAEFNQREIIADRLNLPPNSPERLRFTATGKLLGEEKAGLTAGDKAAIYKAEDALPNIQSTIDALGRAKELNGKTYTGKTAGFIGIAGDSFPGAGLLLDKQKAADTREFNQLMSQEAIKAMSATLKGATTDREMDRFIEILGDPSTSPAIRANTIDRLRKLADRQLELAEGRISDLRGGTYFKPRGAPQQSQGQGRGQSSPEQAAPPAFNPSDIVDRKTVGGKTYARTSDGRVFEVAP